MNGERVETGYIDLLYRSKVGWQVVDFKTDVIRNDATRTKLIEQYKFQLLRYEKAFSSLLGQSAQVSLCFLDDNNMVRIVKFDCPTQILTSHTVFA